MNTIIQYVQISSAVYILAVFAVSLGVAIRYAVTGRSSNINISGYPAFLGLVACAVCAVSTLVLLP